MTGNRPRRLVLLRHAKSAWPDVPDHQRPLAPRGRRDAPAAGRWLQRQGCVPDLVLCSTARRARETWELAQAELGASPPVRYEQAIYGASADGLLAVIRAAPAATRTVLVVGHDPALPELALCLAEGGAGQQAKRQQPGDLDRVRSKFPTAALAVLAFTGPWPRLGPGGARLTDFVTPREIRG